MENGYKLHEIFGMELRDISLWTELVDGETGQSSELTEDFLSLLM